MSDAGSMLDRVPAIKLSLPLISGIIIGWYCSVSLYVILLVILLLSIMTVLSLRSKNKGIALTFHLLALMICLGVLKITLDSKIKPDNSILNYVTDEEQNATLVGVVNDRAVARTKSYSMTVEAESLFVGGQSRPVDGDVLVSIWNDEVQPDLISNLSYGRKVALNGIIRLPASVRNPGDFDYRRYLKLQGIYAQLVVKHGKGVILKEVTGNWLLSGVIHPFRDWISVTMDSLVGGDESKLLKGLVIGERSEIDPNIKLAFTNAGLMHILAVSGLNVGLVTIMLWSVFSLFRLPRMCIGILTIISLFIFGILTGGEASVLRAVIMASVLIGGKIFEQKVNLYNVVGISGFIILLIDARWLFDVGFQLSFVAVLSLAYIYPKLETLFSMIPKWENANSFLKKYVFLSIAVSLAATIGTLPFTAYYFHKISIVGIIMNLIAVPLSGVILLLGCIVVLAAGISTWLGSVYAVAAYASAWLLLKFTDWGGNLPFAVIPFNINFPEAIGLCVAIFVLFEFHRPLVRRISIILILLGMNVVVYASIVVSQNKSLRVTMIDVGQGDAIFIELPNGKNALVDAGPKNFNSAMNGNRVTSFLQQRGIKTIDAFIVTHPHADHIGGACDVLKTEQVLSVYESNAKSQSNIVANFEHSVDSLHIYHEIVHAGEIIRLDENVRLYILHPFSLQDSLGRNLNNHSVVIKLVYDKSSLLLCGDAEEPVEQMLTTYYSGFLRSDVVKAGHHGSITSSSEEFIDVIKPTMALISVGYKNKFHHPSPAVLDRYQTMGCLSERTDKHGAIILESNGVHWQQVEWRDN